jgi:hypothetical protein
VVVFLDGVWVTSIVQAVLTIGWGVLPHGVGRFAPGGGAFCPGTCGGVGKGDVTKPVFSSSKQ